jgi:hypothetical protein
MRDHWRNILEGIVCLATYQVFIWSRGPGTRRKAGETVFSEPLTSVADRLWNQVDLS